MRGASSRPEQLLQCVSLAVARALPAPELFQDCGEDSHGPRRMDATALEVLVEERQVGAAAEGGSTLRNHTLSQFEREHTDAGTRTASAGVGSTPLVVCSPLGCIPRRAGTWDPAAVGTHRW